MAHLIDKDALVAEIEKLMNRYDSEYDEESTEVNAAKGNVCHEILCTIDSLEVKEVDLTDREKLEVMIVTTISGLEATYKHFKGKYPIGSSGSFTCSNIPAVKHLVETYLIELNKEIQIQNLKEEIKRL